jgi:hypothetical protein
MLSAETFRRIGTPLDRIALYDGSWSEWVQLKSSVRLSLLTLTGLLQGQEGLKTPIELEV